MNKSKQAKSMKRLLTVAGLVFITAASNQVYAQNGVGINPTGAAADPSAALDVASTNKGVLVPRMTEAEKIAIASPANGLLIFQTDGVSGFWYYNTTTSAWVQAVGPQGATGAQGPVGATGATGSIGSVTAISGTSDANGATISGGNLTLTPADETNGGIVTNGTQTFGGDKTFNGNIVGQAITSNMPYYGINHKYLDVDMSTYIQDNSAGWFGTKSDHPLWFYTNDSYARMSLTTSGDLGIGTTLPTERLDVVGNIRSSGNLTAGAVTYPNTDGANGQVLSTNGSGSLSWVSPQSGPAGPTGATGAAGANGSNGAAGADGKTVLNGTNNPTSGIGNNGDFYINTSTSTLFGPKAAGTWPTGVSLIGAAGATGPQGPVGATGATGSVGSVTAISGTSNANGATINSNTGSLTLTPADANNGGVVTTGAQTFAGSKTFSSAIKITAGAPGAGKVLTSDATGLASWTTPAASANTVTMTYLIVKDGIYPSSSGTGGAFFIGQIIPWAGIGNVPGDCYECKGQLLPISQNQALFSVIGATYGGNGVTNFALPNLTGKSIIGN